MHARSPNLLQHREQVQRIAVTPIHGQSRSGLREAVLDAGHAAYHAQRGSPDVLENRGAGGGRGIRPGNQDSRLTSRSAAATHFVRSLISQAGLPDKAQPSAARPGPSRAPAVWPRPRGPAITTAFHSIRSRENTRTELLPTSLNNKNNPAAHPRNRDLPDDANAPALYLDRPRRSANE